MKMNMDMDLVNRRNGLFALACIVTMAIVYEPMRYLLFSSSHGEYYSHIIMIPFVSAFLIYLSRKEIFKDRIYSVKQGIPVILMGVIVYLLGRYFKVQLVDNDYVSTIALSAVIFINGAFILFYGVRTFKAALFPLLFLFFVIPIPSLLMDRIIYSLQVGSTEFVNILLMATGVPFLREGFAFHLPSMSVEVAKQCSGIRSCLALFITALLA